MSLGHIARWATGLPESSGSPTLKPGISKSDRSVSWEEVRQHGCSGIGTIYVRYFHRRQRKIVCLQARKHAKVYLPVLANSIVPYRATYKKLKPE